MAQPRAEWSTADLSANLDAKLDELCAVAARTLEPTWAEVGTRAGDKQAAIAALKEQLTHTFLAALQRETDVRDQLRSEVAHAIAQIHRAAADLGDEATLPHSVSTGSLRDRASAAAVELKAWKGKRGEREEVSERLRADISQLCAQLAREQLEEAGTVLERAPLSEEALQLLGRYAKDLAHERDRRLQVAERLESQIAELRLALSGAHATAPAQAPHGDDALGRLGDEAIHQLEATLSQLEVTRRERVAAIDEARARVATLCGQLGLELEPEAASAAAKDVSEVAVTAWRSEADRLEKLRRASLERLVAEAMAELQGLWEQLGIAQAERDERVRATAARKAAVAPDGPVALGTQPSAEDCAAFEHALEEMGAEMERLRAMQAEIAPIVRLRAKRAELRAQRADLEAAQSDKSRLTSRRDPGRLLREERQRRAVSVDLPRVSGKLVEALVAWEERHGGQPFLFQGRPLRPEVEAEEAAEVAKAERKVSARVETGARKDNSTTPAGAVPATGRSGAGTMRAHATPRAVHTAVRFHTLARTTASTADGTSRAATAPRPTAGSASAQGRGTAAEGTPEAFKAVPLSLQQILAAAEVDDDDQDGQVGYSGVGVSPPPDPTRKTLTYRLRDEAAAAAAAEASREATRRVTVTEGARPKTAGTGGRSGTGQAHAAVRTVESVVKLAARLKQEAKENAAAAEDARHGKTPPRPLHATPSKAVLRAFAESNGLGQQGGGVPTQAPAATSSAGRMGVASAADRQQQQHHTPDAARSRNLIDLSTPPSGRTSSNRRATTDEVLQEPSRNRGGGEARILRAGRHATGCLELLRIIMDLDLHLAGRSSLFAELHWSYWDSHHPPRAAAGCCGPL
eukprot:CAMPEP_0185173900 /NCGR_PEP_ID=MMETSP1139-20130426/24242_1 /TAXON_ID=298111 /ORGANISM="Pavlova sp., Strain CCMP459" /LENGTH=861 /DNA_ID=CAMNT_0027739607 /DNA_START=30 /DNA_END=2613 /DNA_ORIENTATION=-